MASDLSKMHKFSRAFTLTAHSVETSNTHALSRLDVEALPRPLFRTHRLLGERVLAIEEARRDGVPDIILPRTLSERGELSLAG